MKNLFKHDALPCSMDALVVVDMQKEWIDDIWQKEKIIENCVRLVKHFNNKHQLVVCLQDYHTNQKDKEFERWGPHAMAGTVKAELIDELDGLPHKRVRKTRYSGFFNTNLAKLLRENKVKRVYICGIFTGHCVLGTAIDAYQEDFDVVVVKDASGTSNKTEQEHSLAVIQKLAASVSTTAHVIREVKNQ